MGTKLCQCGHEKHKHVKRKFNCKIKGCDCIIFDREYAREQEKKKDKKMLDLKKIFKR